MKTIRYLLTIIVFVILPGAAACSGNTARPPAKSTTIAFVKYSEDVEDDIYSIQTDGTGLTKLAHEPGSNLWHPAWSPDGTKIAFSSGIGNYQTFTVWSMNADDSGKVQLTQLQNAGLFPTWSPDGKQIAFSGWSTDSGLLQITIMNANGSDIHVVTSGKSNDLFPAWAPDGRIFFDREPYPANLGDVFAVNPDGSGLVQITRKGGIRGFALSPDGKSLVLDDYLSKRIVKFPTTPAGNEVTLVDAFYECDHITLTWSPDGKAVALGCSPLDAFMGPTALYIVSADGSGFKKVENAGLVFDPDWRPK